MWRRSGAVVVLCAMLAVTAFVPIALADDHLIVKESNGPRGSAITWTYVPPVYGVYTAKIVNSGLRWLVLDVYDNTSGMQELILHQKIRFSAYGAAPSGKVYSDPVMMAQWHTYEITATPNGPRSSFAVVSDGFDGPHAPVASFTLTAAYDSAFVNASSSSDQDNDIVDYLWNWGDGEESAGVLADHTYATAGIFNITLTVLDITGLTDTVSHDVYIVPCYPPPVADFTMTVDYRTVLFDASASFDSDGILVSYVWDFGDGTTGAGLTTTHTYAAGGYYEVNLVVTDDDGYVGACTYGIQLPDSFLPPTASFTMTASGLTVAADGSGSWDADGVIVSYAWHWGDGTTGSGMTASHFYEVAGLYSITLTVTDDDGLTCTMSSSVISIG